MEKENDVVPHEMPEAYHKARRQLSLFSAILIFWEYVGIRFGEKAEEPITTKMPLFDVKVRLENPEVIPVIIVLLVLYFSFRITIEWKQSDINRRAEMAPRVDLVTSYFLAFVSLALFIFQQLFAFRLADFLTPIAFLFVFSGFIIPFLAWLLTWFLRHAHEKTFWLFYKFGNFRMKIFCNLIMLSAWAVLILSSEELYGRRFAFQKEVALFYYFICAAIAYLTLWSISRIKKYFFIKKLKAKGIPLDEIIKEWDRRKEGELKNT